MFPLALALALSQPDPGRAFVAAHCASCHAGEKAKGGVRLDTLSADFADKTVRDRWAAALEQVKTGTMPPAAKPRPDPKEVASLAAWADARETARRAVQGRTVARRLNRVEYENTVRDLLGVDVKLKEAFPADATANGFDTSGDAHHVSAFLMDSYLDAADKALAVAIANGPRPAFTKKRYSIADERGVKVSTEKVFRKDDAALVMFSSSAWNAITVGQFYPSERGRYRIRISAQAIQSGGKPVAFRIDAGPMLMGTKSHLVDYFDAPADAPKVFEFVEHFDARDHVRISPYGLAVAQTVTKVGADAYTGPGLAVQWVEVEGPLHDTWPPESHARLFGDLPQATTRGRAEVVSKNPEADAATVLKRFARRAFRRTVTDADVSPFLALVKARLAEGYSFERAVRVGLKAVMVSPSFLFLDEKPGKLDDFALAARLSYFLWSTTPDDELLTLAERGELSKNLRSQVERMLDSPRAAAFVENFTGQWLGLRDIDFTAPDFRLYPEFDESLKVAMLKEAHLFFAALVRDDLGVANVVSSDFTFLNGRLAKHYGIAGVDGSAFRKVSVPPGSHRGGMLTMAGVLKVTANGTNTSPVVRGAWVLDRILGQPPAPPPAGVPAVEPDIRGATTIRDQLAKHRATPSCNTCHVKIDPPGFALESFDVIGGWRDHYRSLGRGPAVVIDGRRMMYQRGPMVDPSDSLGGEKFADIDGLKSLLLKDPDQLARSLAEKLVTYGTGAPPTPLDKPKVDAIVRATREKGYGVRTLIHEVVRSEMFQRK